MAPKMLGVCCDNKQSHKWVSNKMSPCGRVILSSLRKFLDLSFIFWQDHFGQIQGGRDLSTQAFTCSARVPGSQNAAGRGLCNANVSAESNARPSHGVSPASDCDGLGSVPLVDSMLIGKNETPRFGFGDVFQGVQSRQRPSLVA